MKFFEKTDKSLYEEDVKIEQIDIENSDAFIDYSEYETTILGEETEYEKNVLKKKKRKKKILQFLQLLKEKQDRNSNYQINKIHFLEELKIGKQKLKNPVTIPNVYVVEYEKKWDDIKNKELKKYEIYNDETKKMIMRTDSQGNLVLTKEMEKLLGPNSKMLGLEKKEKIRVRQINDMLWISSQTMLQKSIKEQQEKVNISKINQSLDVQKERIKQNPILKKFEQAKEELQKQGFLQEKIEEKDYKNIINILSSDNYLTLDDAKTAIKISQISKELEENGELSSKLTEKEMIKVKEKLNSNADATAKEVKEAIQDEIGLERLPRKPY